ncbi:hypothetical protein CFIO01_00833 [Colletotrichum fioriniae PJ7]|uniref:Uncharacterized protein n=1 Tax=Colletotrichum fioriniae PJ7 TaxID=1445577 RepID=A0A010QJ16_9PEZI|nr:hypothetical protein CFIO01_00833 [Colletotrichum fioriniae PJ7]
MMAQLQEKHKAKQTGSRAVQKLSDNAYHQGLYIIQTYLDNLRRLKGGWDVATAVTIINSSFDNKAVPNEVKDLIRYSCKPRQASDDGNYYQYKAGDGTYTLCYLPNIGTSWTYEYTLSCFGPESELRLGNLMILSVITTGASANPVPRGCRFKIPVHMDLGGRILAMDANYEWKPGDTSGPGRWPLVAAAKIIRY